MPAKKTVAPAAATPATKSAKPAEKVVEKPVETKAAAPAPAAAPATDAVSPLADLAAKIGVLASALKEAQNSLKVLTKEYDRMKKLVEKTERKRANARTQPSGFAKPTKISDEMCDFLGVPRGTELSRTDVTRKINAYVKQHNLNKPDNKRIILPDAKLKKILGVTGNEEVSFFVLQRYIKNHFLKSTA
jgi:chromatin remodeling complex protein RSC6